MSEKPSDRFTREELESDSAFAAAEAILTGEFGDPPCEEAWADVYGGILDAVLTDLRVAGETPCVCGHRIEIAARALSEHLSNVEAFTSIEVGPVLESRLKDLREALTIQSQARA